MFTHYKKLLIVSQFGHTAQLDDNANARKFTTVSPSDNWKRLPEWHWLTRLET